MSACVVSLDYLSILQVPVYVYSARRVPTHFRCTQCSILLHLINVCFIPCICLRQISQIQTCLRVIVGPGLVSTSPAWPACPQNGKSGHIAGGRRGRYCLHNDFTDHCDSYIAVADILTSYYLFLFLRHSVNQCVSRFYGTIVEEAA